jgi:Flp pilus assembly protein TadD
MSRRANKKAVAAEAAGWDVRWTIPGVCFFLTGITWLVFEQTFHYPFINFDDGEYVFKNPHVIRGLTIDGIVWAFTHAHAANWHPVTWLSHMLDCQFYGLNAGGHHLTNFLIHAASAIVLFLVLRQMTLAVWRSAFVAAVFAIHPLRVESVVWIAERKDVLSALFFLLMIGAYVRYARAPWSLRRYGLILLLFALGLMCKPMLVTAPFVLLLLDYWPLNRFATLRDREGRHLKIRGLILEKLPLLGLAIVSCVITLFAQTGAMQPVARISLPLRLGNAVVSYVDYLRQMFWPSDLAIFYPWEVARLGISRIVLSILLLAGASAAVFILRRYRYLVTGWLWYLVMLGPVIGILQVGNQARADRYTYLPQIGLYLLLTWGAVDLSARWNRRRVFLGSLSVIIVVFLIFSARNQVSYWQNSEVLWSRALASTTDNVMAQENLGEAVFQQGRTDEAIGHFQRALQIEPNLATSHASLGAALLRKGQWNEALAHLRRALEIDPRQAPAHSSLGVVLLEMGRPDESLAHLRKALEIDPNDADANYNLANTFLQMGRANEALVHYRKAVQLDPNDTQAMNNMSWILATWPDALTRDGAKAVELAKRADSLTRSESPIISATLAAAYAEAGRFAEAIQTAQRALQLATAEGNHARATSIREQIELYQSGAAFRDKRASASFP